ncbi:MAG: hypothetical protein IRF6MM_04295 [Candidatus Midichloria mitochondrii]
MDYIVRTEKIALIKPWFAEFSNAHVHQVQRNHNARTIVQDMGIEYIPVYKRNVNDENYDFRFNKGGRSQAYIEISGYDYLVNVDSYTIGGSGFIRDITLDNAGIKLAVKLGPSTNLYVVQINTNESVTFELEDLIEKLNTTTNNANSIEKFIMEKESTTLTIQSMLKQRFHLLILCFC